MTDVDVVGFAWWAPANGGSQQAFVQNVKGIERAGYRASVYDHRSINQMVADAERGALDWAFVPFVFNPEWVAALSEHTHTHLQIGGYGRDDWDAAADAIAAADSVSVLDPQLAPAFDALDAPWVPNPPNVELFDASPGGEYVLVPKQHPDGGLGAARGMIEAHDGDVVVLGGSFADVPENVTVKPKVPLSWMPELYAGAEAVVNPAPREGLPNVAYEAFLTATPYVAPTDAAIGSTQAQNIPPIDEIGVPVEDMKPGYYGDHFVKDLTDATASVGEAGRSWVEQWRDDGWGWGDKFAYIGDNLID